MDVCWFISKKRLDFLFIWKYSGTPLIWSLMGQKKLAVLTGDRINEGFFLQENVWPFCQAAKKGAK